MNARAFNPWPIAQRETRRLSRRRGTYVIRITVSLLLALVLAFPLMAVIRENAWGSSFQTARRLATIPPIVGVAVLWLEYFMLTTIASTVAGTWFREERQARSLPALMTSPLNAISIIVGQLIGRSSDILIAALIPIPALLAVRLLGGTDLTLLAWGFATVLSTTFLVACLSIGGAPSTRRRAGGSGNVIIWMLILEFFLPGILALLPVRMALGGISYVPSHDNLISLSVSIMGETPLPREDMISNALITSAGYVGLGIIALLLSARTLRRHAMAADSPSLPRRWFRFKQRPTPIAAGAPKARSRSSGDRASRRLSGPSVLWRELRRTTNDSLMGKMSFVLLLSVPLIVIYSTGKISDPSIQSLVAGTLVFITLVRVVSHAATSVTSERESQTLDTLLTTPVRARDIVLQKSIGATTVAWVPMLVATVHFLFISLPADAVGPTGFMVVALMIVSMAAVAGSIGVCASCMASRTSQANGLATIALFGLYLFLPLAVILTAALVPRSVFSIPDGLSAILAGLHPVLLAPAAVSAATWGNAANGLVGTEISSTAMVLVAIGTTLIHLGLAYAIVRLGAVILVRRMRTAR